MGREGGREGDHIISRQFRHNYHLNILKSEYIFWGRNKRIMDYVEKKDNVHVELKDEGCCHMKLTV